MDDLRVNTMSSNVTKTFTFEGKRYYVRASNETEAIKKLTLLKRDLEEGLVKESRKTVNEWFNEFIEVYKANVKQETRDNYVSIYNSNIKPYIGALPLKSVGVRECQRVVNATQGKSKSTVDKVNIVLHSMLEKAVKEKLLNSNPSDEMTKPQAEAGKRRALTPKEREAFLKIAPQCGKIGQFCLMVYYCGLRPSEVAKLKGKDINRKNYLISIDGGKTKSATREVPYPTYFDIPSVGKNEIIYTNNIGTAYTKSRLCKSWNKILSMMEDELGSDYKDDLTMYCLRHDYCTRLQEAEVPIDVARRLMGHSSIEITSKIYTHESKITLNSAAKAIENYNKPCK